MKTSLPITTIIEENFFIVEGEIDILVDGKVNHFKQGNLIHIRPGEVHFYINNSNAPIKMISTLGLHQEVDKVVIENYTY